MDTDHCLVSVCLCTYKRPQFLSDCLDSLLIQVFEKSFEIIVTDNDCKRSAELIIINKRTAFQGKMIPLTYLVEPIQNIALARNRCVASAKGQFVAFIDDDERASVVWLQNLYHALVETNACGACGPVIPEIPESFPLWMRRSGIFHRKNPMNGAMLQNSEFRTGNAIIRHELLDSRTGPFNEELGKTGGEDSELFDWIKIHYANARFVWVTNAVVNERIEEQRKYLRWHIKRAYRGGWVYSKTLVRKYGLLQGMLRSTVRIIPSFLKACCLAAHNGKNIQYAGFLILGNISTNMGKCGFFGGIKIEEYNG